MEDKTTFRISGDVLVDVYSNFRNLNKKVFIPKQCHGSKIVEIITGDENLDNCDALITSNMDFSLGIKTADCAAICFYDGEKKGIAHIGWRGLCLSLLEKMSSQFNSKDVRIFLGPFMHSFEIKKDFCFIQIQGKFGDKYFVESEGKITFLFKDAIMSLLPKNAEFDARNTFLDLSLPSFRRDKTLERLATVI